jgi:cell volume regulation protein A
MEEVLLYLTYFGVILLIGMLLTIVAKKMRVPNYLLLILAGIFIGSMEYQGKPLIYFEPVFLTVLALLALVMIVFDAGSRFKIKEFDALSWSALKLSMIFLGLNMIILSFLVHYAYSYTGLSWIMALLFAAAMSGTSPSAVLTALKGVKTKVFSLLEVESILNTPLIILIPFLLLGWVEQAGGIIQLSEITTQIVPFARQFIVGIGAGIVVGLVIFKVMSRRYHKTISPLAALTAAILTYIISEYLGGNGVLAVTVMGLFFGNVYIRHKQKLMEFSETISTILEVIVFIFVGMIIKFPLNAEFFYISLTLFGAFLLIRYIAVQLSFTGKLNFTQKEKLFIALTCPKGIAVAVIAFTLATKITLPGMTDILDLILAFLIYSVVFSSIIMRFSKKFVDVEAIKKETFKK